MKRSIQIILLAVLLFGGALEIIPAYAQENTCAGSFEAVSIPLNDLGNSEYVRMDGTETGFTGGLYPNGSNIRPPVHNARGVALGNAITPLGVDGQPNPNGRIVMISVGMSNAAQEFRDFVTAAKQDPTLNPQLVLVNGAQPGAISGDWVDANAETWNEVDRRLNSGGLTPEQVQIAWVKDTQKFYGDFPEKIQSIQVDLEQIARNLKTRYPNIKIAYYSSRTRSYTYWQGLSPEPSAFESGFAVKWMIEKQIEGDPQLNFDPSQGAVVAPYLSWGAYFWADGLNPRSDQLIWEPEDMAPDCTHPSRQGSAKVVGMLMNFFKTDETAKPWFLAQSQNETTPSPTQTPNQNENSTSIQRDWMDEFLSLWDGYLVNTRVPN
ncbi:MAG TPA: hypothetical protein DEH25_00990 [Chloroflexi bacterium]|nr:hypothetical protein [Chloroflexota bacterium]